MAGAIYNWWNFLGILVLAWGPVKALNIENTGMEPPAYIVTVDKTDNGCGISGSIQVNISGQSPPFTYRLEQSGLLMQVEGPVNEPEHIFEGLGPGTYTVRVEAQGGYEYTEAVVLGNSSGIDLLAEATKEVTCEPGRIELGFVGGPPEPRFALWSYSDTAGNLSSIYEDLASIPEADLVSDTLYFFNEPGFYTFARVDTSGCRILSNPIYLDEGPSVQYVLNNSDPSCSGTGDDKELGSFNLTLGETNGYTVSYILAYPDGSSRVLDLPRVFDLVPGDYTLTIRQTRGGLSCDFIEFFTINESTADLGADLILTQEFDCNQNAVLEFQNPTGGTPPYEYSIDGFRYFSGPGSEVFTLTEGGDYLGYMRDINGCTYVTLPVVVKDFSFLEEPEVRVVSQDCSGSQSDVTVNAQGGEGPYVFEIITPSPIAASSVFGDSGRFDGLSAGTYDFRVTDANGCFQTVTYTLDPREAISFDQLQITEASCFGGASGSLRTRLFNQTEAYEYLLNGPGGPRTGTGDSEFLEISDLEAGSYTLSISETITTCTGNLTFTIPGPPEPLQLSVLTIPDCPDSDPLQLDASGGWGGYQYALVSPDGITLETSSEGLFSNLDRNGNYELVVTDSLGCSVRETLAITNAIDLSVTPVYGCGGNGPENELMLDFGPGTDPEGLLYGLDSEDPAFYTLDPNFENLAVGPHVLYVLNATGCTRSFPFVIRPSGPPLELDIRQTGLGSIEVEVTGGRPEYTYFFNGENFGNSGAYTATVSGPVIVRVTDSNGCEVMGNVDLIACEEEIPNYFTPDGDSVEDVWAPGCLDELPSARTVIFDRYGRELYVIPSGGEPWNGSLEGKALPTGDYWFVVRYTLNNQNKELFGHFTLVR